MSMCTFVLRLGFLAFFALNAWNTLQNHGTHTTKFKENYKKFETTLSARTGVQLPEVLRHANVHKHSELIVTIIAYAQLGFSAVALLICGGLTSVVGFTYFIQQVIHLNFAGISGKTTFGELEQLALAIALLMGSYAVSGCYSASCGKSKCTTSSKTQDKSSVQTDRASQSKEKKRH